MQQQKKKKQKTENGNTAGTTMEIWETMMYE